jgi:hypothetical protein
MLLDFINRSALPSDKYSHYLLMVLTTELTAKINMPEAIIILLTRQSRASGTLVKAKKTYNFLYIR